ncbi:uncharacterized protein LOC125499741 [Athalia rosae]|uniref:uncharacterized protein LOC125499741 n=1 Tax=Athalia rosae TaxID=37344 RepID=UPI0020333AEF|nr:uncharacterized protein LOC125499741 [Athalia rosae]
MPFCGLRQLVVSSLSGLTRAYFFGIDVLCVKSRLTLDRSGGTTQPSPPDPSANVQTYANRHWCISNFRTSARPRWTQRLITWMHECTETVHVECPKTMIDSVVS